MEIRVLTKQDILTGNYPSFKAMKVAPDRIRAVTSEDVRNDRNEFQQDERGTHFFDLEGRRHQVEMGKCLVIGTSPEDRRATSQEKVDRYRYPVSSVDGEGFRLYRLKDPRVLICYDIPHAFDLDNQNGAARWQCKHPTGGYIVWDGNPASSMRVIQREIFDQTYERV
jgi:hypothetical protein